MKPSTYTSGLGETLRAHRLYLGISKDCMARRLGMNPRSYERIERNQRDCPPGLLDTVEQVAAEFEESVDDLRDSDAELIVTAQTDEWLRAVYGRTAVETGRALHSEP